MTTSTAHYLTPPQYAERLGVDPAKVIVWIKREELRAFNSAKDPNGMPRYLIPRDAIVEFESRRSVKQLAKPARTPRRKRKQQDADYIWYF